MRIQDVDEVTKNIIICEYLIEEMKKDNEIIQKLMQELRIETLKLQEA